jgi:alginate O-acetyltransferase complex protein AlgI
MKCNGTISSFSVAKEKYLPSAKEVLSISLTFGLTVFAWIFFRAEI